MLSKLPDRVRGMSSGRPDLREKWYHQGSYSYRTCVDAFHDGWSRYGDVPLTFADTRLLAFLTGISPGTSLRDGVGAFVDWYKAYYKI